MEIPEYLQGWCPCPHHLIPAGSGAAPAPPAHGGIPPRGSQLSILGFGEGLVPASPSTEGKVDSVDPQILLVDLLGDGGEVPSGDFLFHQETSFSNLETSFPNSNWNYPIKAS